MPLPDARRSCRRLTLLGGLLPALTCSPAAADENHYRDMLLGERAMGMAGAYTAVSDDPSGLYYNPAGVVYRQQTNISASVNAYQQSRTTYEGALGSEDWERRSSALLPNFFGVVQPLGPGVAGFSFAVPDSAQEDQDQEFRDLAGTSTDRYVINFNHQLQLYKVGPSYAMPVTDDLSVGATLYLHYRTDEIISNQWVRKDNGDFEWLNQYYETTELGVEPVLGVMWTPWERLSLGLTLRQPQILSADTESQVTCNSDIATNPNAACQDASGTVDPANPPGPFITSTSDKRTLPLEATVGVAYFHSSRLLVSADLAYHTGPDDDFQERDPTWNAAVGAEYYLSGNWAVRSGLYTNRANTPSLDDGGVNQPEHIDYYGAAFSLTRFTRNSSITGGFSLSRGSGEAQVIGGSTDIQDVRAGSEMFFLSTSYAF
jgi:long-chain fatty acid transport protein